MNIVGTKDTDNDTDDGLNVGVGIVDWSRAQSVAKRILLRKPTPSNYYSDSLQADFADLTRQAEQLVAEATGWAPVGGPARARVVDRGEWVEANLRSIERLLGPTMKRLELQRSAKAANGRAGSSSTTGSSGATACSQLSSLAKSTAELFSQGSLDMTKVSRTVSGAQLGLILAWMSSRVLGQYDLLVTDDSGEDQDLVYYVGPNIIGVEQRYGFSSRQFRLWIALHELTHRGQFTAVTWLRDYFLSLVDKGLEPLTSDPQQFGDVLRRVMSEIRAGRSPIGDAGLLGLLTTPEQLEAFEKAQALMSLLEGHGDVMMNRAGQGVLTGARRFSDVLRQRRKSAKGAAKLIQSAFGMEAKLRQYSDGEEFVKVIESTGGPELFNQVWNGPDWLPTLVEIRDPNLWVARVDSGVASAAI